MHYKHTQIGYVIIFSLIIVAGLTTFLSQVATPKETKIIMGIVFLILLSFSTLTVSIDQQKLSVKFGYGIFKKTFLLSEIASAKQVKNHWYYGWGIRFRPTNSTWIFNVSGYDAVEIVTKKGRTYRVGTDEPEKLTDVISRAI